MRYVRKRREVEAESISKVDHVDAAGGAIVILSGGARRVLTMAMTRNQQPVEGDYLVKFAEGIERLVRKNFFEEEYEVERNGKTEEKSGN